MSFISQEKITEIRESVDIVNIISNYVPLVPKGKNFFGVCPFHDDNHPSMSVSPDKKIYKCFSCGATGNVFKFIMDYENITYPEALKKVADIGGVALNINIKQKAPKDSELYKLYDFSLKFYTNNINTKAGKDAKEYLSKRGITDEIIKEFQIGLALNGYDDLSKIIKKKYKSEDIEKSGLVGKNDYGYYDLFKNRIMFPLWNLTGQTVAYSGRIYNHEDTSKYFNTRETEIFEKGKLLYNYHRAKESARQKNVVIVMEGFMDVIRAYSVGIKNAVATMGTAVTKTQATLIKRMAKEVILCFDGDEAGAKATASCADILIEAGVIPKVIRLENNMDPDEYIKAKGKESFEQKLKNPISIMDFKLQYLKTGKNLDSTVDQAKYINDAIAEINKIDDDILREITIKKIIEETGIDENLFRRKITPNEKPKIIKKEIKTNKYYIAQRNLLNYMLKSKEVITMYSNKVTYMPNKEYRLLAREISMFYRDYGYIDEAQFIDYIQCDKDLMNTISVITGANLKENFSIDEIEDYIKTIQDYNIKIETNRLKKAMKEEIDPIKKATIAQKIIDLKKGV